MPDWTPGPDQIDDVSVPLDVWRIANGALPSPGGGAVANTMRACAQQAMREILARYLGVAHDALRIERADGGKPFVELDGGTLHFNLSHCSDLALLAVSRDADVGIDVERERRIDDPLRLARRVFSATELATLRAADSTRRTRLFIELWTRLEARQKTLGRGIFATAVDPAALQCLTFMPTQRHYACVCCADSLPSRATRYFDYAPTLS